MLAGDVRCGCHEGRSVHGQRQIRRAVRDAAAGAERRNRGDREKVRYAGRHAGDYAGSLRRAHFFSAIRTTSKREATPKETSASLPLTKKVGVARTPLSSPPRTWSRIR